MIYMNFMKTDLFTTGPLGDCCAGVGRDSAKGSKDSWNLLRSTKSGEKGFHGPAFCAASCQKQGEEKIVSKIVRYRWISLLIIFFLFSDYKQNEISTLALVRIPVKTSSL